MSLFSLSFSVLIYSFFFSSALFGECPADRRERLRNYIAKHGHQVEDHFASEDRKESNEDETKTWYHEGSQDLLESRFWLANYSLSRAKERLERARERAELPEKTREAIDQEDYKKLRKFDISASQVADQRPISSVSFSPNAQLIASSSWSGLCKVWTTSGLQEKLTLRGHNCNSDRINWHPNATISNDVNDLNLVSCGVDGTVFYWSLASEEPIHQVKGHEPHRVSQAKFHPSGKFLATACYDNSFRLLDVEKGIEILHQEGHSKPVHDVAFQSDGSLIASAGRDSYGRIWDLRTGRCIMFMDGHLKGIISASWSPDGYHLVTGSEDNTIKIWDLRQRCLEYTIAAHNNIVSKVIYEKNFIISTSYDNSLKIWSFPGWTPIKSLSGHDGKIMGADISSDHSKILTCSFDRTFKVWEPSLV